MLALGCTAGGTVFEMWLGETVRPPKALSGNCGGPGQSDSRKVPPSALPSVPYNHASAFSRLPPSGIR